MPQTAPPPWHATRLVGGNVIGLGRAGPLEDAECLPQAGFRLRGTANGQGTAAQPGQRVSLIPRAVDLTGQVQGPPVTRFGLVEVAANPVQRTYLIDRLRAMA
jgi:hypothetical protein